MIGQRVKLVAPTWGLVLRSPFGVIVSLGDWDGYVVVHLDEPATYHGHANGPEELADVVEAFDNLEPA